MIKYVLNILNFVSNNFMYFISRIPSLEICVWFTFLIYNGYCVYASWIHFPHISSKAPNCTIYLPSKTLEWRDFIFGAYSCSVY